LGWFSGSTNETTNETFCDCFDVIACAAPLCVPKTWSVLIWRENCLSSATMVALMILFLNLIGSLLKSKSGLEAENAALRHQLTVL